MAAIPKNSSGIVFELLIVKPGTTIPEDVSAGSPVEIIFETPLEVDKVRTASFTTDGLDGRIQYTVLASDLNLAGVWMARGRITEGANIFYTSQISFRVSD